MVRKTRTMTLGRPKKDISWIVGTSFTPKIIYIYHYIFCCYIKKPVDVVFKQNIDDIEEVIQNHERP